jgi:hypothetical protein
MLRNFEDSKMLLNLEVINYIQLEFYIAQNCIVTVHNELETVRKELDYNANLGATQECSGHVKDGHDNPSHYKRCRVKQPGPST